MKKLTISKIKNSTLFKVLKASIFFVLAINLFFFIELGFVFDESIFWATISKFPLVCCLSCIILFLKKNM
ncbi:hypothetical protein B0186_09625 [Canicola haemoglobinophilus]|nr:hypothetical protein B0186_09625 [Canicola haemoglobinophilus]